jgi:hypothetical protein
LFGDTIGIPQLIKNIPIDNVVAIIGASIRPQYNLVLKNLSKKTWPSIYCTTKVGIIGV